MQPTIVTSITFPAKAVYIPLAVAAARTSAEDIGFPLDDVERMSLAAEEAMAHVLEFGFNGPHDAVRLHIIRTALGLRIEINFHGLPLDTTLLPQYAPERADKYGDTTGISQLLIEKMLDTASFAAQPGGIRTVSMEKYLPTTHVNPASASDNKPSVHHKTPHHVRLAVPEDAEAISRLAFQAHGAVLLNEHIYYPVRVARMIECGQMVSAVVETTDGRIMGHGALLSHVYVGSGMVEELTYGFVDPHFRGQQCATELAAFLEAHARKRGIYAIEAFAVTNHVHSQRAILRLGFQECGLLLCSSPASQHWVENDASERISILMLTKYLGTFTDTLLYPPPQHQDIITRIYNEAGICARCAESAPDTTALAEESHIWTLSDFSESWTAIGIERYGHDILAQIRERIDVAASQNITCIHVGVPLSDPFTPKATAALEDMGFFFAGVAADESRAPMLILQRITIPLPDFETIQVDSDLARLIKSYVHAQATRQRE